MRHIPLVLACLLTACAATTDKAPVEQVAAGAPLQVDADEARRICLDRLAVARSRGAAHWAMYDQCLKEPH